jgi:hypothetical protein
MRSQRDQKIQTRYTRTKLFIQKAKEERNGRGARPVRDNHQHALAINLQLIAHLSRQLPRIIFRQYIRRRAFFQQHKNLPFP